jgi:hypothetical protein
LVAVAPHLSDRTGIACPPRAFPQRRTHRRRIATPFCASQKEMLAKHGGPFLIRHRSRNRTVHGKTTSRTRRGCRHTRRRGWGKQIRQGTQQASYDGGPDQLQVLCGELAADAGDVEEEKVEMRLLFGEANPVRAGPSHPIRRDPEAFPSCSTLETVTDCSERASRRRAGTWPAV